ncbi:MAG: SoxR reducing system RseC family protein [Ectothiorhodospiraceae bacterium]|nr:SoxR reducing system RseC family protein [Ectothiorhodospiraceae bacterium]
MSGEIGIVVEVRDDHVVVETQRQSTCGGCSLRPGCGTALLERMLGARRSRVRALADLRLKPGDRVSLALSDAALLQASALMYGLPVLGLLLGAMVPALAGSPEWLVTAGGLGGLAAGLVGVRQWAHRLRHDSRFLPLVTGLHAEDSEWRTDAS